jgi:hypothetical protein
MCETANGKPDAITLHAPNYSISVRILLVTLGTFLLLRGNTLPWPCLPPPEAYSYCSPLLIDAASAAQLTLLLVTGCLLIALAVNLLFTPMDFVLWLVLLALHTCYWSPGFVRWSFWIRWQCTPRWLGSMIS